MKITDLRTTTITIPIKGKPERWAFGVCEPSLSAVIVELITDTGQSGWGEAICVHPSALITRTIIDSSKRFLVGQSPFDVEKIMKSIYIGGAWHWHRHAANWALAGIEMALWDLMGKECGKPVYKLLGGSFREKIPFVAFIFRDDPQAMAQEARDFLSQGFQTFYLKVGIDQVEDLKVVASVREAIGPQCSLRVDANEAWSPATALRMLEKLKEFALEFVEQPLLASDLDGLARLRQATAVPIGADQSAWTLYEVLQVIRQNSADVLVLDPGKLEGLWGFKKGAALAEAAGLPICTHAGNTFGIGTAAILHLSASTPNVLYANQTYYYRLEDDILETPFEFRAGCLQVPELPGLGVQPNLEKIRHYAAYHEQSSAAFTSRPYDPDVTPMIPGY